MWFIRRDHLLQHLREFSLKRAPEGQPFILASGKSSMTYLDVRKTALSAEGHMMLGAMLFEVIQKLKDVDAVAGVVLGGCPLASAASMFSAFTAVFGGPRALPSLYVRKAAKEYGAKNLVEGIFEPGMRVALVEDVVTTGSSSMQAIHTLREAGLSVAGVAAVVDREEGGAQAFSQAEIPFLALTTMREVLGD